MTIEKGPLSGLLILTPQVFEDERGYFYESFNAEKLKDFGIAPDFPQDNHSFSKKNVLRGLHFQSSPGQAKLVRCVHGKIWDVAVDIRTESPTFKQWFGIELSEENKKMFYIPVGFAHGFCVLSETAEVLYKISSVYNGATETGIAWNDPDISVNWPIQNPLLSERDRQAKPLAEYLGEPEVSS